MYYRYISRKTSPMFNQIPVHRQSPPASQRYAPLSDVIQRAQKDPNSISAAEEYHLHKAIGSKATLKILAGQKTDWVPKFEGISAKIKRQQAQQAEVAKAKAEQPIQAKLTIGQPNDKYELEADRVADRVVQQINTPAPIQSTQPESLQRQLEAEEIQPKQNISSLQRSPTSTIQPEAIGGGEASAELTSAINSAKGSGQPLDAGLQESMGQAMGTNFSGVRIHTDNRSDKLNQSIQAKAFTTGQDVFFRQGEYQPGNREGQKLIAHELTHVVQQNHLAMQPLSSLLIQCGKKKKGKQQQKTKSQQKESKAMRSFNNLLHYRPGWVKKNGITFDLVKEFIQTYKNGIRGHHSGDKSKGEQQNTTNDCIAYKSWHTQKFGWK